MDEPEVGERFEDITVEDGTGYTPNRFTVSLKDGIDIRELATEKEAEFEVQKNDEEEEEEKRYFSGEELFQQYMDLEFAMDGDDDDDDNEDDETGPFQRIARKMTDISGNGKVLKLIKREGSGPVIPDGAIARVHYNGYLEHQDDPFDSTYLRQQPFQVKLGEGSILGFDIALRSMRKGEKSWFYVHWEYAYGKMGVAPRIGEESDVMFVIEMLSYVDSNAVDSFSNFTEEERRNASLDHILQVAQEERQAGNEFYSNKEISKAMTKFYKAIQILEKHNLKNEYEEKKMNQELLPLCLNMALCCLKQHQSPRAIKYARKALAINPRSVKGMFRLGKAYKQLSEYDKARDWLMKAQKREPNNPEITKELAHLESLVQRFKSLEKNFCAKMFGQAPAATAGAKAGKKETSQKMDDVQLKILTNQLRDFQKEEDLTELPFPPSLTEFERETVIKLAKEMGLFSDLRETKNKQLQLRIHKKPRFETSSDAGCE